ncbi:MAG: preprotein translocase subunit SecY, partial [Deinococcus sp.]|nr:preprotein translocase subunit SecY [Deinococcus sp.]
MLRAFADAFRIADLRAKILYTLLLIAVFRLGSFIPTPGVDPNLAQDVFGSGPTATLFSFLSLISGGGLSRFSIFALGIIPYVSASIIIQLLTVVVPYFEKLAKEGEEGRRRLNQYTRYGALVFGAVQAFGFA